MQRLLYLAIAPSLFLLAALGAFAEQTSKDGASTSSDTGWTRLFDGNTLHGWYTVLQKHKQNEDPDKIFQVEDGVIHVYKDQPEGIEVPSGYISSDSEYAFYDLRFDYKWGTKRFKPCAKERRDAGLIYHIVGRDGVWPRCIECQVQENDVGDCYTVMGAQVATSVEMVTVDTPGGPKKLPQYKPAANGGEAKTVGSAGINRIIKSKTPEHEGWNTVEVIVRGSEGARHIVNGQTVFEAKDLRQLAKDKKTWEPLAHGRIALQSEFAEIYYRNIEIRAIPEGPLHPPAATQ